MAAVVASLAAFLAGCGLPALPVGVNRDSNQGRDICAEDSPSRVCSEDSPSTAVWQSACKLQSAPRADSVATPVTVVAGAAPWAPIKAVPALEDAPHGLQTGTKGKPHKQVTFKLGLSTSYEVTPYSEVYGIHPRDFQFGKTGMEMVAKRKKQNAVDLCDSDEDSDDEEFSTKRSKAVQFLTHRGFADASHALTRPCCFAMAAVCLMLRLFGAQVCLELLGEALAVPKEAWSGVLPTAA